MNNLLLQKNEEILKQVSADFFTLTVYSKDIQNLDKFRLKDFIDCDKNYNLNDKNDNLFTLQRYLNDHKLKLLSSFFISALLMKSFRSILILPFFFYGYFMTKRLFFRSNQYDSNNCKCYFCNKNYNKIETLDEYDSHYKLITKVLQRNSKISNISEFEKELDKYYKQMEK